MRIQPIRFASVQNVQKKNYQKINKNDFNVSKENMSNVNFNGYCGKISGILAGGATAIGLAIVAAPVLVCAGPVLAAAGMLAGDKLEDDINEAMKK